MEKDFSFDTHRDEWRSRIEHLLISFDPEIAEETLSAHFNTTNVRLHRDKVERDEGERERAREERHSLGANGYGQADLFVVACIRIQSFWRMILAKRELARRLFDLYTKEYAEFEQRQERELDEGLRVLDTMQLEREKEERKYLHHDEQQRKQNAARRIQRQYRRHKSFKMIGGDPLNSNDRWMRTVQKDVEEIQGEVDLLKNEVEKVNERLFQLLDERDNLRRAREQLQQKIEETIKEIQRKRR